jgi:hypothetical protein
MRIRFLSDQIYENGGPGKGPKFPKGLVLDGADVAKALDLKKEPTADWVESFLGRWTQRGLAEEVGNDVPTGMPNDEDPDSYEAMTVKALHALADERGIDLGDATKKADIIAAIQLADESEKSE